jgi:hypothetical protein
MEPNFSVAVLTYFPSSRNDRLGSRETGACARSRTCGNSGSSVGACSSLRSAFGCNSSSPLSPAARSRWWWSPLGDAFGGGCGAGGSEGSSQGKDSWPCGLRLILMDGGRVGDWEGAMEWGIWLAFYAPGSRTACRVGWVVVSFFFWNANTSCALRLRTVVDGCGGWQRQVRFV